MTGCSHQIGSIFSAYEERRIVIQLATLFEQNNVKSPREISWAGDWIFRRQRLNVLDDQLGAIKPDIVLLQGLTYREFSPSESEVKILSAGALANYNWHVSKVDENITTEEVIATGAAFALPLKVDTMRTYSEQQSWDIGAVNGYVILSRFLTPSGGGALVSIKLPPENLKFWYERLELALEEIIQKSEICPERFIFAGELPEDKIDNADESIFERLGFKDAATGYCGDLTECYTEDGTNPINKSLSDGVVPTRNLRMYVHGQTKIYASLRNLTNTVKIDARNDKYKIGEMSASHRYGWLSTILLPKCD
jgi:hypothetical protein